MSLMPLGILGFRPAGASSAGTFELISTQILGASATSVTFSSLPTTYTHLQIRVSTIYPGSASSSGSHKLTFNSDTAANYNQYAMYTTGGLAPTSSATTAQTSIFTGEYNNDTAPNNALEANMFAPSIINILEYRNANKIKVIQGSSYSDVPNRSFSNYYFNGYWNSTSAITSITLAASTGNYKTNSRFSLYGIKGA